MNVATSWRLADMARYSRPLFGMLLISLCLSGCSLLGLDAAQHNGVEVGMHIDARLEFAVEYPLSWDKERLLYPDENRGLVRWTASGNRTVRLTVSSAPRTSEAAELQQALRQLPGLQTTRREQIVVAAVPADHLIGHTARANYRIWFLSAPRRTFLLQFEAPPELFDSYAGVLAEILESFQILDSDAATPHSH
ncbi:MAG: hypothetical protein RQ723_07195 [Desulfuromonadales bacterium]|nr:hypothetical protein [Desulfuromonadales bacterium]